LRTVSYNANNGFGPVPDTTTFEIGMDSSEVLFDPLPSRAGYVFVGWSSSPTEFDDHRTVEYGFTTPYEDRFFIGSTDVVFYAQWQEIPSASKFLLTNAATDQDRNREITWDPDENGGSGAYKYRVATNDANTTWSTWLILESNIIQFSSSGGFRWGSIVFTLTNNTPYPNDYRLYVVLDAISINDSRTAAGNNKVNINPGAKVIFQLVGDSTIIHNSISSAAIRAVEDGSGYSDVIITGQGEGSLKISRTNAAISTGALIGGNGGVSAGQSGEKGGHIRIESGSLELYHNSGGATLRGASIGGGGRTDGGYASGGDGGVFEMHGGKIESYQNSTLAVYSPAIGGGGASDTSIRAGHGGIITITGGSIDISQDCSDGTYGLRGAAIGGASNRNSKSGDSGTIDISGGTIIIKQTSGAVSGTGIGAASGQYYYASPGHAIGVNETGGQNYVSISGGYIEIHQTKTGTSIYGTLRGAGIGGGAGTEPGVPGGGADVRISGGYVLVDRKCTGTITRGQGAAIGGGAEETQPSVVNITGGNVNVRVSITAGTAAAYAGAALGSNLAPHSGSYVQIDGGVINISRTRGTAEMNVPIGSNGDFGKSPIINGGSIRASGNMDLTSGGYVVEDSQGKTLMMYVIDLEPTDNPQSLFVRKAGFLYSEYNDTERYADFHVQGRHMNLDVAGMYYDYLNLYLPIVDETTPHEISLEYDPSGLVKTFTAYKHSVSGDAVVAETNVGTTMYRVVYRLGNKLRYEDDIVHIADNVEFTQSIRAKTAHLNEAVAPWSLSYVERHNIDHNDDTAGKSVTSLGGEYDYFASEAPLVLAAGTVLVKTSYGNIEFKTGQHISGRLVITASDADRIDVVYHDDYTYIEDTTVTGPRSLTRVVGEGYNPIIIGYNVSDDPWERDGTELIAMTLPEPIDVLWTSALYKFVEWRLGSSAGSAYDPGDIYTIPAGSSTIDFYSVWGIRGYDVTVTIIGDEYGVVDYTIEGVTNTLTESGTIFVPDGESITLEHRVTALDGAFVSWTGDIYSTEPSIILSSGDNSDLYQTVMFASTVDTWELTLNPGAGATADVTYGSMTFTYPSSGNMNIPNGEAYVELKDPLPVGKAFLYWWGTENYVTQAFTANIDGTNIDRSYTAAYDDEANVVTLTIEAPVKGTIGLKVNSLTISDIPFGEPFNVSKDHTAELSAAPMPDYAFLHWVTDTLGNCGNNPWSFRVSADTEVDSMFVLATDVRVLTLTAAAGGSASYAYTSPSSLTITGSVTTSSINVNIPMNTYVSLTHAASGGYAFTYWSGSKPGVDSPLIFEMDAPYSVTANFTNNGRALTIGTDGGPGTVSITIAATSTTFVLVESTDDTPAVKTITLPLNATGSLTASTSLPSHFSAWYSGSTPALSGPDPTVYFSLTGNQSATALFTKGISDRTLTLSVTGTGTITLEFDSYVIHDITRGGVRAIYLSDGTDVILEAVETDDASPFEFWRRTAGVSFDNPFDVKMDQDHALDAVFTTSGALQVNIGVPFSDGTVGVYIDGDPYPTTTVTTGTWTRNLPVGAVVTLVPGSDFSFWAGTYGGVANPLTFTLSINSVSVDAYFAPGGSDLVIDIEGTGNVVVKSLSTSLGVVIPASGFTVTPAGAPLTILLASGTSVELEAAPAPPAGGIFSYWSGSYPGIEPELTFAMGGSDEAVTANFVVGVPVYLTLDTAGGPGTVGVSVDGDQIYSGTSVTVPFTSGTEVEISATAAGGNFSYWTVNTAASPLGFRIFDTPQEIIMGGTYSLTANFTAAGDEKSLDLDVGGAGTGSINVIVAAGGGSQSISSAKTLYFSTGADVALAAETVSDMFSYWSVVGALPAAFDILKGTTQTVRMNGNYDLTAVFAGPGYSTLTLSVIETGTITVTIDGVSSTVTSYTGYFDNTATVGLTAVEGAYTKFSYWSAGAGSLPAGFDPIEPTLQSVGMGSSYNIVANFTETSYRLLKIDIYPAGAGEVDIGIGGSTVTTVTSLQEMYITTDTVVVLTADAYGSDNMFSFWSGTREGISDTLNVTMSIAHDITAVFAATTGGVTPWDLDVEADGPGKVHALIDGYPIVISDFYGLGGIPVTDGVLVELEARPDTLDDTFYLWVNGPDDGTSTNPSTFYIDDDHYIIAMFTSADVLDLTINIVGNGTVDYSINGGTTYIAYPGYTVQIPSGTTVHLQANPGGSSAFSFWSGDYEGVSDGASDDVFFTMNHSHTITALFTTGTPYTLALSIAGGEGSIGVSVEISSVMYGFTYTSAMMPGVVNIDSGVGVTLKAVPGPNNQFSYWSGTAVPPTFRIGLVENAFPMNDDYNLTANFTGIDHRSLTLDISGAGTIDLKIGAYTHTIVEADPAYVGYFNSTDTVSLTAAPVNPLITYFSYWNVTGSTPGGFDILEDTEQVFTTNVNYVLTAVFTSVPWYTLDISAAGNGEVTVVLGSGTSTIASGGSRTLYLNEDTEVGLLATETVPDKFSYWLIPVAGNIPASFDISRGTLQTIKMEGHYDLTAVFTNGTYYELTLKAVGPAGTYIAGTYIEVTPVGGGGSFEVRSVSYKGYFSYGDQVELAASNDAATPNRFSYWSGTSMPAISTMNAGQTVTVEDSYDMTANFTSNNPRMLIVGIDGDGSVEVRFDGSVIGILYSNTVTYASNGVQVTLTAAPITGVFSFWSSNAGDSVSNVLAFAMSRDRNATAVFTDGDHDLSLAVNGAAYGSISTTIETLTDIYTISIFGTIATPVSIPLSDGTQVSLGAVPSTSPFTRHFSFWTGTVPGTLNPLDITMDGDYGQTAYFTDGANDVQLVVIFDDNLGNVELTVPSLSASPVPLVSGETVWLSKDLTISLMGIAAQITPVNHFSYWSSFIASIDNPWEFTLNNLSYTVYAYFTDGTDDQELILDTAGAGKISLVIETAMGPVGPIDVVSGGTWFNGGTEIKLTPVATGAGNRFSYWSGSAMPDDFDTSSGAQQTVEMEDSYSLTANFTDGSNDRNLALNVNGDGMISVTISSHTFTTDHLDIWLSDGDTVTIEAVPDTSGTPAWKFSNWEMSATSDTPSPFFSTTEANTFEMDGDYDLTAIFFKDGTGFMLDLGVDGNGKIGLTVGGFAETVTVHFSHEFASNTEVIIEAIPDTVSTPAWKFSNWEMSATSDTPSPFYALSEDNIFEMDGDYNLTAIFFEDGTGFMLDLDVDGNGKIGLTVGGFAETVTVPFSHEFASNTEVTIEAIPGTVSTPAWKFSNWEVSAMSDTPSPFYALSDTNTFEMDGDYDLTAVFFEDGTGFMLELDVDGNGKIELTVGGFTETVTTPFHYEFAPDTEVTIEAVPDTSGTPVWKFSNWEVSATSGTPSPFSVLSEDNTFEMDGDYDLTAIFFADGTGFTLELGVTGNGTIGLTVGGFTETVTTPFSHEFAPDTEVTIEAIPNTLSTPAWKFSNWSMSATSGVPSPFSSLSDTNTFEIDGDYDLTAAFFEDGTGFMLDLDVDGNGTIGLTVGGFTETVTTPFHYEFASNMEVTIEAVPDTSGTPVWKFSNWVMSATSGTPSPFSVLSEDNTFRMGGNYDLTAVFFADGTGFTLGLDVDGNGKIELTIGGFTETATTPFSHEFAPGTEVTIEAIPDTLSTPPWEFSNWDISANSGTPAPFSAMYDTNTFDMDGDFDLTAVFTPLPIGLLYYSITATADGGSTIFPSGKVAVLRGDNQTFKFSPAEGFVISALIVDGITLSQEYIDRGFYTFRAVNMNHSIEVKSVRDPRAGITLTIDVMGGKGHAEYSVNNEPPIRYTAAVNLSMYDDLTLRAYADDGYEFKEWKDGNSVYTDSVISFSVTGNMQLELYFKEDKGLFDSLMWWFIGVILLLVILGILIWIFLFYRRTYEVIRVDYSASIAGKERARRRRAYTFSVEGGPAETVSYRVGEEGQWKTLSPNQNGEYVIPAGDVTDKLTIERR